MKLTSEQWIEVSLALHFGLSNFAWEGLPNITWTDLNRDQKIRVLAALKESAIRQVARSGAHPSAAKHNEQWIAHFDLENVERQAQQEEAMRIAWHADKGTEKQKIRSFQSSVNEVLSQALHFSSDQTRAVNRRLAARKLPLLAELSAKLSRRRAAILQRGKIRNDDEYYVVKEIICDQASDVPDPDREKFEAMFGAYEARKQKPG